MDARRLAESQYLDLAMGQVAAAATSSEAAPSLPMEMGGFCIQTDRNFGHQLFIIPLLHVQETTP